MSWLTDGGSERRCCCLTSGEREISSSPLLSFSVVLFVPSLSLYSLFFGSIDFGLPLLSPLSHSFFLFSLSLRVPSSLFSLLFLFFFSPHLWFRCRDLFIEPVIVAFHYGAWGTGHVAAGRGCSCPGLPPSVSAARRVVGDTTKRLMSSPNCRSVEVINNPARPGSNHIEVNCINYK